MIQDSAISTIEGEPRFQGWMTRFWIDAIHYHIHCIVCGQLCNCRSCRHL